MKRISNTVENISDAISIRFNNFVYGLKKSGNDVIVLSLGEAFFDIPLYSFEKLSYPDIYHYSHSRGVFELRQKICQYYLSQYGTNINPNTEILISAGSKVAIYFVFRTLLNPGDDVLIPDPSWVSYPEQVKLCESNPISIPYWEDIFNIEKYITPKTKLIVINNPNNPIGKVYSQNELEHLVNIARKHNLYILSDEAYSDFVAEDKFYSLGKLDPKKEHVVICNSISKNFGISGWRIGYSITNSNLNEQLLKLNQHIITCAPTILQHYLVEYFDLIGEKTRSQISILLEKRKIVASYMDEIGINYLAGSATFYFFISISTSSLKSEEFCMRLLEKYYISTVPGIGYGKSCDSFIRISFGVEPLQRIKQALQIIYQLIVQTSITRINLQPEKMT